MTYGLQDVVQVSRMLAESSAGEQHKRVERQRLEALLGYCETAGCRRQALLAYFGETLDEGPCGNCDTCLEPVATFDGTVAAQKLLSTVLRTGQRFGAGHLIDVLLGNDNERIRKLGHQRLSTFGIGTEFDARGWRSVARQLIANGQLQPDPDGYGGLVVGPGAAAVLRGERTVELREDRTEKATPASAASGTKGRARAAADLDDAERERFEALRAVRAAIAREQGVPAYVVFHDATLVEMIKQRPTSLTDLAAVPGVGATKLERYGERFLEALATGEG
jgi:ATP-dependent DNA helicase RecQ